MTINVRSAADVRIAHQSRYFLIRDTAGVMRVVSVPKLTELSPYVSSSTERRYKYATRPGGYQNSWSQADISRQFHSSTDARPASQVHISQLVNAGVIRVGDQATSVAKPAVSVAVSPGQFAGGYVIGSVTSTGISFSSNPKVHATAASAEAEAERLASVNAGKEFVVFKAAMSAVKASVVTRKF